jgi:hypothetical protein
MFFQTRTEVMTNVRSGVFMFITLLVVGCLGAVAGQGDFEPYLREHKAFGKAVAAMICLYGTCTQVYLAWSGTLS